MPDPPRRGSGSSRRCKYPCHGRRTRRLRPHHYRTRPTPAAQCGVPLEAPWWTHECLRLLLCPSASTISCRDMSARARATRGHGRSAQGGRAPARRRDPIARAIRIREHAYACARRVRVPIASATNVPAMPDTQHTLWRPPSARRIDDSSISVTSGTAGPPRIGDMARLRTWPRVGCACFGDDSSQISPPFRLCSRSELQQERNCCFVSLRLFGR
jgi:hypothetical protein